MQARIFSIYDEGAAERTSYIGAKGLAMMAEVDGCRTLFDTGRNGRYLIHNMEHMEIDPGSIGRVVISHGHRDHFGGLEDLIKMREEPLDVYVPGSVWKDRAFSKAYGKYNGPDAGGKAAFHTLDAWTVLSDHLAVTAPIGYGDGESECFLVIGTREGPAVLSGCSHCGVRSVMDEVKAHTGTFPRMYLGGVHIGKKEDDKADGIAAVFSDCACKDLYLNHCTGLNGITRLRVNLGLGGVSDFYVGSSVELEV